MPFMVCFALKLKELVVCGGEWHAFCLRPTAEIDFIYKLGYRIHTHMLSTETKFHET